MDIRSKVTQKDKDQFSNLITEAQVLENLTKERRKMIEEKVKKILERCNLSPALYALQFNLTKDTWDAVLREGALVIPKPSPAKKVKLN